MTDQVSPEGGATPATGANPSFAQAKAEAHEADVKAKPKEGAAASPPAADPSEKPAKPPKSGEQVRIDELTRRLREAERRNERLLRLAEERGQPPPPTQQPAQQPQVEKTLKDFNYDTEQFARYERERARADAAETAKQLAQQLREQEAEQRRREKFEERAAAFAKANEDYNEVIQSAWACSKPMAEVIEESEEGPALAYYLAQNPDIAQQMAKLSAAQAGRELARLEDRLISERKRAAEKPVTQAPPPPPKIEGADPGNVEKDPSKMTDAQYRKWREAAIARRGR